MCTRSEHSSILVPVRMCRNCVGATQGHHIHILCVMRERNRYTPPFRMLSRHWRAWKQRYPERSAPSTAVSYATSASPSNTTTCPV
eukprot:187716-Prymnesium_polylepis.3